MLTSVMLLRGYVNNGVDMTYMCVAMILVWQCATTYDVVGMVLYGNVVVCCRTSGIQQWQGRDCIPFCCDVCVIADLCCVGI